MGEAFYAVASLRCTRNDFCLCLPIEQHKEWQTNNVKRSLTVQWKALRARDSTWDQGRFHP